MFTHHYYAAHYFPPRYWPPKLASVTPTPEAPAVTLSTRTKIHLAQALGSQGGAEELVSILDAASGLPSPPPYGSAWTQTYATASHTIAAVTTNAITDSSGGTASTTALASQSVATTATDGTTPSAACTKASVDAVLAVIRNNLSTLAAEVVLLKADLLAMKKNDNALIDDLQAGNLVT